MNEKKGNTENRTTFFVPVISGICLVFLFLLPSCYTTREVGIQVLHPPEKILFNTPRNLVLLNRMPGEELWKDTLRFHDLKIPVKMYNDLTWKVIYGFTDVASDSPWTDKILFDSLMVDSLGHQLPLQLGTVLWKEILQKNGGQTCIDMASLWLRDSITRSQEFAIVDEEGEAAWMTTINVWLFTRTVWFVYDEEKGLLDSTVLYDTIRLSSAGHSYRSALSRLPSLKKAVFDLARMSGEHYAYLIFPVWDPVQRIYYAGGNPSLKKAGRYAEENKWLAAAEIWRRLAYTAGNRTAARAAFNMALVSEINDKLGLAEEWLRRSLDLEDNKITRQYLEIIRNRLLDYKKMNLEISPY